ncbi:PREDICTED: translation initiation factor IF-2-like, partial [Chinchilla lanigera]|uniref:translation initiation factor IF-2-like n=1 Tax=Chinchilla lanigera TaxID=34839 RepID=UPI000695A68D
PCGAAASRGARSPARAQRPRRAGPTCCRRLGSSEPRPRAAVCAQRARAGSTAANPAARGSRGSRNPGPAAARAAPSRCLDPAKMPALSQCPLSSVQGAAAARSVSSVLMSTLAALGTPCVRSVNSADRRMSCKRGLL